MSFRVKVEGLDELLRKVKTLPKEVQREVGAEIGKSAEDMARVAKDFAPVNLGYLKSKISAKKVDELTYAVISAAPYSAYVEFGTKSKVEVPKGYEELASKAKGGSGGSWLDLYDAILKWVKRKKIVTGRQRGSNKAEREESAAWFIAMKIAKNGIPATHYFTRGIDSIKPRMMRNLRKIVEG